MAANIKTRLRESNLRFVRKHLLAQAEVINSANLLQDTFFELFSIALTLDRFGPFNGEVHFSEHCRAIWHVIKSDVQQRELALAAITTVPTKLKIKAAFHRLNWVNQQLRTVAQYRNLLAHNPVKLRPTYKGYGEVEFRPAFGGRGTKSAHEKRFELIKGLKLWRAIRNDLLDLTNYVSQINRRIRQEAYTANPDNFVGAKPILVGTSRTWPRKPRLRSLRRLREIDRIVSPAPAKKVRRARRKSSQL